MREGLKKGGGGGGRVVSQEKNGRNPSEWGPE